MAEPEGKVRVRLGVDPAVHDALRVLAARCGMSMSRYCELLVAGAVRDGKLVREPEPPGRKK